MEGEMSARTDDGPLFSPNRSKADVSRMPERLMISVGVKRPGMGNSRVAESDSGSSDSLGFFRIAGRYRCRFDELT
jgi:hypothetical protein